MKTVPQAANTNQATTSSTNNTASASSASQVLTSGMAQDFAALGQALQAGNLSSAQQAYSAVQHDYSGHGQHHFTSGSTAGMSSIDPILSVLSPNATSLQNSNLLSQLASNVGSTMPLSLLVPSFSAMI